MCRRVCTYCSLTVLVKEPKKFPVFCFVFSNYSNFTAGDYQRYKKTGSVLIGKDKYTIFVKRKYLDQKRCCNTILYQDYFRLILLNVQCKFGLVITGPKLQVVSIGISEIPPLTFVDMHNIYASLDSDDIGISAEETITSTDTLNITY